MNMSRFVPIDITIKTMMGTEFVVSNIHPCETVRMLKVTIQDAHGLRCSLQNLLFGRQKLEDDEKELHHYGVDHQGCVLTLVMTMRGGPLNARRSLSTSSLEPDTELVLELLDGVDVIGAVTLDDEIFDLLPGAEGKPFYVYFPGGSEMPLPLDLQRFVFMDVDDCVGDYAEEGAAESPLFGDCDGLDSAACHSPMCTSRARTRSYGSPKLRRDKEEREKMEVKVERLRSQMTSIRAVKKAVRNVNRKRQELERDTEVRASQVHPKPSMARLTEMRPSQHTRMSTSDANELSGGLSVYANRTALCAEPPSRAEGPTPLRACGGQSSLDRMLLERSPDPTLNAACRHDRDSKLGRSHHSRLPPSTLLLHQTNGDTIGDACPEAVSPTIVRKPYQASDDQAARSLRRNTRAKSVSVSLQPQAVPKSLSQHVLKNAGRLSNSQHHIGSVAHFDTGSTAAAAAMPAEATVAQQLRERQGNGPLHRRDPLYAATAPGHNHGQGIQLHRVSSRDSLDIMLPREATLLPREATWRPTSPDDPPLGVVHHQVTRKPSIGGGEPRGLTLPHIHPTRAGQCNVSNTSLAAPKLVQAEAAAAKPKEGRTPRQRCSQCGKKLTLAGTFTCRCGRLLCTKHRYAETHTCTYDYKTEGRRELKHANPAVHALKLPKI